ncbi:hypothetical protein DY000_02054851 [Brassica cretica]|uniref:Uncharacterized protein n=1 Tax=Brassica cretica TaxID=69181 RepID=A0ABQ7A4L2_BRACR|nr:hypothetical protein DY000_02054851 [Brassica cretica]
MKLLDEDTYSPLKAERSCKEEDDEKLDRKPVDVIFATSLTIGLGPWAYNLFDVGYLDFRERLFITRFAWTLNVLQQLSYKSISKKNKFLVYLKFKGEK